MVCNNNTNQITDISTLQFIRKLRSFLHIISMHHAEQWNSHRTIRFRPDTPADIRPHPVSAAFQKFESGTSPRFTEIVIIFATIIPWWTMIQLCHIESVGLRLHVIATSWLHCSCMMYLI